MQNPSLFIRRVRNLFLALILAGTAVAARADEPPACAVSDPPAQCNPTDDLPQDVDPWEDDLPGKRGPIGENGVFARLLDAARRLVGLDMGDLAREPSLRSLAQP